MKKLSSIKLITGISVATAGIVPLIVCASCSNFKEIKQETIVKCKSILSYQHFARFEVENPSDDGFFKISIDNQLCDWKNSNNNFVTVSECTNSLLTLQPQSQNDNIVHKYTIEYFSNNESIFNSTYYLQDDVNFTLVISQKKQYFDRFNTNLQIEAYDAAKPEAPMNDIKWKYQLMDEKATSYLEYFSVKSQDNYTKLNLIKTDVKADTSIYVFGINDTGKVGLQIPILSFIAPEIKVSSSSVKLQPGKTASFTFDVSGTTGGFNLQAGWNIYSKSGTPLNVGIEDGNPQKLINNLNINTETLRKSNFKNDLEWLFNSSGTGCFDGIQGIKNDLLKIQLNTKFFIPSLGGLLIEGVLLSPDGNTVLTKTDLYSIDYDSITKSLVLETNNENDLYYEQDVSSLGVQYYPYTWDKGYDMQIDTDEFGEIKYMGWNKTLNTKSGKKDPGEQKTGIEAVKYLLEGDSKPSITPDPNSNGFIFSCKLQHQLNLPIVTQEGDDASEQRSIEIILKINVLNDKKEIITSFPISISILNNNRINNLKYEDFLLKPGVLDVYKFKNKLETEKKGEYWKSELYIPKKIANVDLTEITYENLYPVNYRTDDYNCQIRQISFQKGCSITKIDGCTDTSIYSKYKNEFYAAVENTVIPSFTDPQPLHRIVESIDGGSGTPFGAFSHLIKLESLDFTNAKELTTIGDGAFYWSSGPGKTISNIVFPAKLKSIGYFAFYRQLGLQKISFMPCGTSDQSQIALLPYCFASEDPVNSPSPLKHIICLPGSKTAKTETVTKQLDKIMRGAFACDTLLQTINLSNTTLIERWAFAATLKFRNIVFSGNSNSNVFANVEKLLPYDELILTEAFKNPKPFGGDDYVFSYNTVGENVNISCIFDDKSDFLLQSSTNDSEYLPLLSQNNKALIRTSSIEKTYFTNLSCPFIIIKPVLASIKRIKKLDLWSAKLVNEQVLDLKGVKDELEELTLSNSTINLKNKIIICGSSSNGILSSNEETAPALKRITFYQSKLLIGSDDTGCLFDTTFESKYIKNIYSFTYIAPPIGEMSKKDYYSSEVLKNMFPIKTVSGASGVPCFQNIPRNSLLTINIKMSAGKKEDSTLPSNRTTFDCVYDALFIGRSDKDIGILAYSLEEGHTTELVRRARFPTSDANLNVNWIILQ